MEREYLPLPKVIVKSMKNDGNCLFRAISFQLYETDEYHEIIRSFCMDFVEINKDSYSNFVSEYLNVESYISEKRKLGVWGDNIEIQAMSELYHIPIYIYHLDCAYGGLNEKCDGPESYELFCKVLPNFKPQIEDKELFEKMNGKSKASNKPIRLLYYQDVHYDSLHYLEDDSGPIISTKIGVLEFFVFGTLRRIAFSEKLDTLIKTKEKEKRYKRSDFVHKNKFLDYNIDNLTEFGVSDKLFCRQKKSGAVVSNSLLVSGPRYFKHEKESSSMTRFGTTENSEINSYSNSDFHREHDLDSASCLQTKISNGSSCSDVVNDVHSVKVRDRIVRVVPTGDSENSNSEEGCYSSRSSFSDKTISCTNTANKNKVDSNEAVPGTDNCFVVISNDVSFSNRKNDNSFSKGIKLKVPAQNDASLCRNDINEDAPFTKQRKKIDCLIFKNSRLSDAFRNMRKKYVAISCQELNYKYSIQNN
ncbi:cysteine protease [Cryptosporidium bovis]|uniref:cysteine protease n=1 Tax=Cryptosporidium bovis TaxID=310047 RepID=UPI00351A586E|nr:cysteine protease [Cryptosporidium bovis]